MSLKVDLARVSPYPPPGVFYLATTNQSIHWKEEGTKKLFVWKYLLDNGVDETAK